jgi:hypothetical protein
MRFAAPNAGAYGSRPECRSFTVPRWLGRRKIRPAAQDLKPYASLPSARWACYVAGMEQPPDLTPQPAEYYRRKAARAREVAQGATTRAVKLRLLELALEYDKLADGTESATRLPPDLPDV